jgi:cytidine deaminase
MTLADQDIELIERAKDTADQLYVEDFHEVAAALRTKSGDIFTGIHIEASIGFADVCGEVAAICNMVTAGEKEIDTIVAIRSYGDGSYRLLSPCGRCRELISDFNMDAKAVVGSMEQPELMAISDLLPLKNNKELG